MASAAPAAAPAATPRRSKAADTLVPPTQCHAFPDLEYSLHTAPNSIKRDLKGVFPAQAIDKHTPLLVLPVFQRATVVLLEYGDEQTREKDRLLERFFAWHDAFAAALREIHPDAWVDATDPATGTARWGPSAGGYSDVDGIIRLLPFPTQDAGGCRVVKHPAWGFAVYPSSVFTTAPPDAVRAALAAIKPPTL